MNRCRFGRICFDSDIGDASPSYSPANEFISMSCLPILCPGTYRRQSHFSGNCIRPCCMGCLAASRSCSSPAANSADRVRRSPPCFRDIPCRSFGKETGCQASDPETNPLHMFWAKCKKLYLISRLWRPNMPFSHAFPHKL